MFYTFREPHFFTFSVIFSHIASIFTFNVDFLFTFSVIFSHIASIFTFEGATSDIPHSNAMFTPKHDQVRTDL